MAERSYSGQSENSNAEDMDEGSERAREEGNDYEEFGAFGGYGTLTSFDIHLLRAFGSLGSGFRFLAVRPFLGHLLARGLVPCAGGWMKEGGGPSGQGMASFPKPSLWCSGVARASWWEAAGPRGKHYASV